MKIAILSFYSGHNYRGVERWTYELATRLSRRHRVVVFQNWPTKFPTRYEIFSTNIPFNFSRKESSLTLMGRAYLDYKGRKKGWFALKLLPKLWKEKFDVIIPTDGGWEPAFIRFLCWLKSGRMVIVGHAGIGWDDRNNLWNFPDVFVTLSRTAKNWARKANPFVKVEYIPDGVDIGQFRPFGKKRDLNLKKPVILCAGALIPSKRISLTIKAVAKLRNASLLVAGGGELKDELVNEGKKLLGERFDLRLFSFDDMPEVFRSADVFTIASIPSYSFEMVLLEAMATNLAVVANDDPIRREIVGKAGIFVDPTNIDSYAEALDKALRIKWGSKPRKQAEKFSWDKIVKMYEHLFESIVR